MPDAPAISFDEVKPVLLGTGQRYLRRLMREQDLTVTALAAELGISRKHLSKVLNGSVPLRVPARPAVPGSRDRSLPPGLLAG